jgi:hypothetical protein
MNGRTGCEIVRFLEGTSSGPNGQWLADILAYTDQEFEERHDFIQWLFPLKSVSVSVPSSPVLDQSAAEAIQNSPRALQALNTAKKRFMRFLSSTTGWRRSSDHNHLRITRAIKSLGALSGKPSAIEFHRDLLRVLGPDIELISETSKKYWLDAIQD